MGPYFKNRTFSDLQLNIPRDTFYGGLETVVPEPKKIERSAGGLESLTAAAKLLAEAKRPVIVSGEPISVKVI